MLHEAAIKMLEAKAKQLQAKLDKASDPLKRRSLIIIIVDTESKIRALLLDAHRVQRRSNNGYSM